MKKKYGLIAESVDIRYYKLRFFIMVTIYIGSLSIYLLCNHIHLGFLMNDSFDLIVVVAISIVCLPLIFVFGGLILYFLRDEKQYKFYEVELNNPIPVSRKTISFLVEFQDYKGNIIKNETNPVFRLVSLFDESIGDYMNKKALIAYDESNDRLIVVKLIQDK